MKLDLTHVLQQNKEIKDFQSLFSSELFYFTIFFFSLFYFFRLVVLHIFFFFFSFSYTVNSSHGWWTVYIISSFEYRWLFSFSLMSTSNQYITKNVPGFLLQMKIQFLDIKKIGEKSVWSNNIVHSLPTSATIEKDWYKILNTISNTWTKRKKRKRREEKNRGDC